MKLRFSGFPKTIVVHLEERKSCHPKTLLRTGANLVPMALPLMEMRSCIVLAFATIVKTEYWENTVNRYMLHWELQPVQITEYNLRIGNIDN